MSLAPGSAADLRRRVDVLWTFNPLVFATLVLGAHVDLLAGAFVLAATVRSAKVNHPPLSYALRFDTPYGASLTYSGDTAFCQDLIDLATGSDVLLCEASWEHPGEHPEGIHMSGLEAGRTAREAGVSLLVLTHIPPWTDTAAVEIAAAAPPAGSRSARS